MNHQLIEFLAENNSRVSCGSSWMCVSKEKDGTPLYTVYSKSYGKRKATTLYEGYYLSTALKFLNGDVS